MRSGSSPQPIPRDLLSRLGEAPVRFSGADCWPLAAVAAAIGCARSTVQRWVSEGCIPPAVYVKGQWWLSRDVLEMLALGGIRPPGTYKRCRARRFPEPTASGPKVYADPRRPSGGRKPKHS